MPTHLFLTPGFQIHFERLRPEDEEALTDLAARLAALYRDRLRWAHFSRKGKGADWRAFRAADFKHVARYPKLLSTEGGGAATLKAAAAEGARYWLKAVSSVPDHNWLSPMPVQFEFFAHALVREDRVTAEAFVSGSLPPATTSRELLDCFRDLTGSVPLRWGRAGYFVVPGPAAAGRDDDFRTATHRFCRTFLGADMLASAPRYQRINSINWLTLLGPSLRAELDAAVPLPDGDPEVAIERWGDAVLLRAGDQPGLLEALPTLPPAAYVRADALIAPVRGVCAPEPVGWRPSPWPVQDPEGEWYTRRFALAGAQKPEQLQLTAIQLEDAAWSLLTIGLATDVIKLVRPALDRLAVTPTTYGCYLGALLMAQEGEELTVRLQQLSARYPSLAAWPTDLVEHAVAALLGLGSPAEAADLCEQAGGPFLPAAWSVRDPYPRSDRTYALYLQAVTLTGDEAGLRRGLKRLMETRPIFFGEYQRLIFAEIARRTVPLDGPEAALAVLERAKSCGALDPGLQHDDALVSLRPLASFAKLFDQ